MKPLFIILAQVFWVLLFSGLVAPSAGFALGQREYVEAEPRQNSFPIVQNHVAANLYVATNDFPGVVRAAGDLQADITRVTTLTPAIAHEGKNLGKHVILVGSIGKSPLIDQLIRERKIDVSEIAGKWESFLVQVVPQPLPGVANALVICGSDKRGTIYGIYDLSEQIGVSPWHFWADVPAKHHDELFVKAGKFVQGPPSVKYRGIFLNDEAPDLSNWVTEKFGTVPTGTNPPVPPGVANYGRGFYTNLFELILRLKGNYLWPAMWNNAFNEDDTNNPVLANEYGIVMGTSHVEPMMCADKEWNRKGFTQRDWNFTTHSNELMAFWREGLERNKNCESLVTIAMRGKIDTPMSESANVALLEEIVAAQRKIIADVYQTNAASVPQLWALYKEVQEYYERGMRVPDDVTLLWCDDNWGNLRRLPSPEDRRRVGGSGIYYHFDYVGGPRNYKWVNSVSLPRMWEQMTLAHESGANQIWIANVGHLQHVQLPAEFFLTLAWNPEAWPKERVSGFTRLWSEREFGKEFAPQIADIVSQFTQLNARRKPELLAPDTFSVVNYQEANKVVAGWNAVANQAEEISARLPADRRDAFFELALYPVKACANLNALYFAAAKNRLFAAQGRASANDFAAEVKKRFQTDAELSDFYNHQLAGGKWNHLMDQTHIGYTNWQQPDKNILPRVTEIALPDEGKMGVAIEGSTNSWPEFSGEALLPAFDKLNQPSRYIDVFNGGKSPFEFSATASVPWIVLSAVGGRVEKEQRLWINVDWKMAPTGETNGFVKINSGANSVLVQVKLFNPPEPMREKLEGFVEADGCVSIEAEHFTRKVDAVSARWEKIEGLGNAPSAMMILPLTAPSVTPPDNSPRLEYKIFLTSAGKLRVETRIAPTLNFVAGRGLRFAISFDDAPPQIATAVPENYAAGDANDDWQKTVSDNVRKVKTDFELSQAGEHTLKIWMVDSGVVLEKILVDCGGVKSSYLGPPESFRR